MVFMTHFYCERNQQYFRTVLLISENEGIKYQMGGIALELAYTSWVL